MDATKKYELMRNDAGRLYLDACCGCGREMKDKAVIPMLMDGGLGVVCAECLRGLPCVACGGTDTAETTYYGLVFCKECFNRSPRPRVTVELDEDVDEDVRAILELYAEEEDPGEVEPC